MMGFKESEQVWYWTFLGNWRQGLGYNDGAGVAHFWSLAIEEQFYDFLASGVANLAKRHEGIGFGLASIIGGTVVSYGLAWVSWQVLEERFMRKKSRFPYRKGLPNS